MNKYTWKELSDPRRHLLAVSSGVIGGSLLNQKTEWGGYLLGALLAILVVKLFIGDLDKGFQFSLYDILFIVLFGLEGFLGAWLVR